MLTVEIGSLYTNNHYSCQFRIHQTHPHPHPHQLPPPLPFLEIDRWETTIARAVTSSTALFDARKLITLEKKKLKSEDVWAIQYIFNSHPDTNLRWHSLHHRGKEGGKVCYFFVTLLSRLNERGKANDFVNSRKEARAYAEGDWYMWRQRSKPLVDRLLTAYIEKVEHSENYPSNWGNSFAQLFWNS